jgi:hypothetical protein
MRKQATEQNQTNQEPQDLGNLNIPTLMIWMLKNVYEQTTIKRVTKELKHLQKNCNISKRLRFHYCFLEGIEKPLNQKLVDKLVVGTLTRHFYFKPCVRVRSRFADRAIFAYRTFRKSQTVRRAKHLFPYSPINHLQE